MNIIKRIRHFVGFKLLRFVNWLHKDIVEAPLFVPPSKSLAEILVTDPVEHIEESTIERKRRTTNRIKRALESYQVRYPDATIQEFNALDSSTRRRFINEANDLIA